MGEQGQTEQKVGFEKMSTKEAYQKVIGLLRTQAQRERLEGNIEEAENPGLARPEWYWAFQDDQAANALEFFSKIAGPAITSAWDNLFPGNLEAVNAFICVTEAWNDYDRESGQNYRVDKSKYKAYLSSDPTAAALLEVSIDLGMRFPKTLRKIGPALKEWQESELSDGELITKHKGTRIGATLERIAAVSEKYNLLFKTANPSTPLPQSPA